MLAMTIRCARRHHNADPRQKKTAGGGKRDRNGVAAMRSVPVANENNRADSSGERAERGLQTLPVASR
jgi:hypothetical protein